MKKNKILIVAIVVLLVVGIGYVVYNKKQQVEVPSVVDVYVDSKTVGFATAATVNSIGTSILPIHFATSTLATSTSATHNIGIQTDQIDLNLKVTASSTTSQIRWQYEFSNNGTEWFGEDSKTTSGAVVTHQSATTTHYWTPGTIVTSFKNIGLTDIAAKYFRLKVFRGSNSRTAGNNFNLWVETTYKQKSY